MGIKFFVLQLAGMVLFMSSNVIISYSFSPQMVTPYQIAYRYFCVAQLLFNIICMPYWSATTDAYRRGDMEWIRRSGRTLDKQMLIITGVVVLLLTLSQPIFALWIGRDVEIPMCMTALVGLYMLTMLISVRYSYIINGIGALHLQLVMTVGAAIVYVPLAIGVSRISGNILCLLVVMSLVNLPGLTVNIIQYYKILRGTAHGIWIK